MYCADDETTNDRKKEGLGVGRDEEGWDLLARTCIVSDPATSRRETTFLLLARGAKAPCVPMFHFDRREPGNRGRARLAREREAGGEGDGAELADFPLQEN